MASHPGAGALYFIGRCSAGPPREGAHRRENEEPLIRPSVRAGADDIRPYGVSRSTSSTGQWSLPVTSLWMI